VFTLSFMRLQLLLIGLLLLIAQAHAVRVVHVLVALADNANLGSAQVPAAMGNAQIPASNLYWGAAHGVRSQFDRAPEWTRLEAARPAAAHILERAVWKHRDSALYLIADAYDGTQLRTATEDLLLYTSGGGAGSIVAGGMAIPTGGGCDLIVYMGHNGLMDHRIERAYRPEQPHDRAVVILASLSRGFFGNAIRATGARPILWTTGVIVPEAYILRELLAGWILGENDEALRERAAKVYDQHRRCGIAGARRLLVSGW
jgi:hypothetical protein